MYRRHTHAHTSVKLAQIADEACCLKSTSGSTLLTPPGACQHPETRTNQPLVGTGRQPRLSIAQLRFHSPRAIWSVTSVAPQVPAVPQCCSALLLRRFQHCVACPTSRNGPRSKPYHSEGHVQCRAQRYEKRGARSYRALSPRRMLATTTSNACSTSTGEQPAWTIGSGSSKLVPQR